MRKIERIILTLPFVAYIIRKSKENSLLGFQGVSIYDITLFLYKQMKEVGLYERAASISFQLLAAIPAGLLFIIGLIPYLPGASHLKYQILQLFKDIAPNSSSYHLIENMVYDFTIQRHREVFSFGFILLIFYTSNAMIGIIRTFDRSISQKKKYFLHKRWRAIKLTILFLSFTILILIILVGQQHVLFFLANLFNFHPHISYIVKNFEWFIIMFSTYFGIALIYKLAPSVEKRWYLHSAGAIIAAILMVVSTSLFSYWVNHYASYNRVYGPIGTILILMMFIYVNALILIIGFEINVGITYLKNKKMIALQKNK